jgi:hypothetical protein
MNKKIFFISILIFGFFLSINSLHASTGTIDSTYKYARVLKDGSAVNFGCVDPNSSVPYCNVQVTDTELTGYAWGENIGWLSLNCANGSSPLCSASNGNFKVANDGQGNLSGYAWGSTAGWISFWCGNSAVNNCSSNGNFRVTINSNGEFNGYAWSQNFGYIKFECPGTACVKTDWRPSVSSDTDNDGVPNDLDNCPSTPGIQLYQGCPVGDKNIVDFHTVNIGGTTSTKVPLEGVQVRVFDRNNADFQTTVDAIDGLNPSTAGQKKNPNGSLYGLLFEADQGRVGQCVTGSDGICYAGENQVGDLLVIIKWYDAVTGKTVYVGRPKSPSDFTDTNNDGIVDLAVKDFQIIKVFKKGVFQEYRAGSKLVVTGSMLEVVAPDSAVWENGQSIYPFIFTSDSDWNVDVCTEVAQGYSIVGVYDAEGNLISSNNNCLQTFVANETKVVAFEVKEVGSPEPTSKFTITTKHKGKTKKQSITVNDLRKETFKQNLDKVKPSIKEPIKAPNSGKQAKKQGELRSFFNRLFGR